MMEEQKKSISKKEFWIFYVLANVLTWVPLFCFSLILFIESKTSLWLLIISFFASTPVIVALAVNMFQWIFKKQNDRRSFIIISYFFIIAGVIFHAWFFIMYYNNQKDLEAQKIQYKIDRELSASIGSIEECDKLIDSMIKYNCRMEMINKISDLNECLQTAEMFKGEKIYFNASITCISNYAKKTEDAEHCELIADIEYSDLKNQAPDYLQGQVDACISNTYEYINKERGLKEPFYSCLYDFTDNNDYPAALGAYASCVNETGYLLTTYECYSWCADVFPTIYKISAEEAETACENTCNSL